MCTNIDEYIDSYLSETANCWRFDRIEVTFSDVRAVKLKQNENSPHSIAIAGIVWFGFGWRPRVGRFYCQRNRL